jgi:beta-glucanase (GH16 family)
MGAERYQAAVTARRTIVALMALLTASEVLAQQSQQIVSNRPVFELFEEFDDAVWWRTDDRLGGKKINDTGFSDNNISIEDGALVLALTPVPFRDRGNTGASYKSRDLYHYGRYDIVMKAARGSGVISAFYTYTGPVYGDPHDEIDFEFLGRDPYLLHLNYFAAGKARLKRTIELDFDTAEDFHLYTIDWRPGEISWFVDGEEVHRATGLPDEMPSHPGKIIADIWAAKGMRRWAGELDRSALPAKAEVRCISFRPLESNEPTCADKLNAGAGSETPE